MKDRDEVIESKGRKFLFFIEKSKDEEDYIKYEQLRHEIWEDPHDNLPCPRNMASENYFNDGSSLFIGVYAGDKNGNIRRDTTRFIGFAYGYVGVINKETAYEETSNLNFYSQYAAVKKAYRNLKLGLLLKLYQKKMVRDLFHIDSITCTFDPLTGVNAYRNIHKLGMEVIDYKISYYRGFSGLLNRSDVPSDRFLALWRLSKKKIKMSYDLDSLLQTKELVVSSSEKKIKGKAGDVAVQVSREIDCDVLRSLKPYALIEIPYDFYGMLQETDVSDDKVRCIPLDWRIRTRRAFTELFKTGYRIVDFRCKKNNSRNRNFYVLSNKA
jgi:predicted GNAT superfamily acetyltransferase